MIKILRKLLLFTGIWIVLMMTGCTGNIDHIAIDTTLTVNTSFNGSRVMTATIPASAFKYAFGRDVDVLESVINQYTPGDMYCVVDENEDGSATIEMHIDFASRNEYQKKIETICSGNTGETAVTPVINFDYSRSMLKNGYTIEENFTSLDLFYWLSEALITEYPALEDKSVNEIFELGKTEVVFDGESMEMDGAIQISTITSSNAFDSLAVAASLGNDQSVAAEITYVVSNRVVAALGQKLDTLMTGLTPDGAELVYNDGDNARTYTLTFQSDTIQGYITNVNKALRTSNTVFEVTTEGDTESLSAKQSIRQYYDGSYFLDFTDENTTMSYVLRVSPDYTVESCTSTYGYLLNESSAYSRDNCEITMTMASTDAVTAVLGFAVDIDEVDINTEIYSDTHIERSIVFKLSSDAENLIGSSIQERLTAAVSQWGDNEGMSCDKETVLSNVNYSIYMSASSSEELTEMTLAVLGSTADGDNINEELTDSLFSGGTESHKNPWNIHAAYDDTLNLSMFLKGSQITNGIHYKLTYPRGFQAAFAENNMFEDAAVDGASVTCSTYNKVLTVRSTADKRNMEGIIVFILWILSLIVILILAVCNMGDIGTLIMKKRIDLTGRELFKGKSLIQLTIGVMAVICFIFMTIRLLFRIY